MHRFPVLIVLLFAQIAHCSSTNANTRVDLPLYARGRIFAASTSDPIAHVASSSSVLRSTTHALIGFFSGVAAELAHTGLISSPSAHNSSHSTSPRATANCNNRNNRWTRSSATYMAIRGWPKPDAVCAADVFGVPPALADRFSVARLQELTVTRGRATNASARAIADQAQRNWTYVETGIGHQFTRGALECKIDHSAAFRVGGKWHLSTGITNAPSSAWVRDYERLYIDEYLAVGEDGSLVAARMTLPVIGGDGFEATDQATTVEGRWRGAAYPNQFYSMQLGDILAVGEAMEKADLFVQQAESATTASNIAILALPLTLNLVPIALVADVSRKALVLYAVLSDVLTALPMGIKGVELLMIANRRFQSAVTRMGYSGRQEGEEEGSMAGEMWIAECKTREDVWPVGVGFVVVAGVMMVLGIVLEIVARVLFWGGKSRWRRKKWKEDDDEEEGLWEEEEEEACDEMSWGGKRNDVVVMR